MTRESVASSKLFFHCNIIRNKGFWSISAQWLWEFSSFKLVTTIAVLLSLFLLEGKVGEKKDLLPAASKENTRIFFSSLPELEI